MHKPYILKKPIIACSFDKAREVLDNSVCRKVISVSNLDEIA